MQEDIEKALWEAEVYEKMLVRVGRGNTEEIHLHIEDAVIRAAKLQENAFLEERRRKSQEAFETLMAICQRMRELNEL